MVTLTNGQKNASTAFFKFLMDPSRHFFVISGSAGVGKTFLMGYLSNQVMDKYEDACRLIGETPNYTSVHFTATTNKASEVLEQAIQRPVKTIHSTLGLRVTEDYKTGKTLLTRTHNSKKLRNAILFIDESSMIDSGLLKEILELTGDCKVVFVGDHAQMAPVGEPLSPIYELVAPENFATLTEPVRNADSPALMNLCDTLRDVVESGFFKDFGEVPGSVEFLNDEDMQTKLNQVFFDPNPNARILCYTNSRVQTFNTYIREMRNLPSRFVTGEKLVVAQNHAVGANFLSVERQVHVVRHSHDLYDGGWQAYTPDGESLQYYNIEISVSFDAGVPIKVKVPDDPGHLKATLATLKRRKAWSEYFTLKAEFIDLRNVEACTVYKSQGSTYDTVFVDIGNIGTSRDVEQIARMLFVGASRARKKVYFYGNLPGRLLRKTAA